MYAVKFDTIEAREKFREFCEFMGWCFALLNGTTEGWWVSVGDGEDIERQMEYLHDLGAFKYYNE